LINDTIGEFQIDLEGEVKMPEQHEEVKVDKGVFVDQDYRHIMQIPIKNNNISVVKKKYE
jgi:hypothetical protein